MVERERERSEINFGLAATGIDVYSKLLFNFYRVYMKVTFVELSERKRHGTERKRET